MMDKTMIIRVNIKGINEEEQERLFDKARFVGKYEQVQYDSETQELAITTKLELTDEQVKLLSKRPDSSVKAFVNGFSAKLKHVTKVILGTEKELAVEVV